MQMKTQEEDLSQILDVQEHCPTNDRFSEHTKKSIQHFQDYVGERNQLAHNDASIFFDPTLVHSLWKLSSLFISQVYALRGMKIESQLD